MRARAYPVWISRLFIFSVTMLAVTGMLQMPLATRYYLTEVPGLAWTGDFFIVHRLHYLFAALLLFIVGLAVTNWLLEWRDRLALTPFGAARAAILGGLIVSGGLRVYRNLPGVTLDPAFIVTIEWVHLVLAMALGAAALAALIRKSSAYAGPR
ncbi:MAG: 4Fe-4S ferredoxin [Pseudodesulfovibrio sp.]|uniref:4Fe-4S ferredoxin iron-sulfur binding domain-containing protein n=1 Tax=Pseudodesulfovibrio aespoeensis (strain ATCC 700646 / DSM 10631 / Aspo-2) TaxID=643562 RepID=E6VT10_PSEA9|nr:MULTISPECIES: hypothetical protein [Pseudodesulfovibrio]MBU4191963.1 4Fe-4S ferredoxin [Pseudomonadota bacterium]ADU62060.1 4Fe-4S ferredoxin iron-sulfur binding domain-containing protein [Pseudodesulfovibrio aespoeensis Aspo-2]MBU4243710.1 4Fe-4S ferredoxin [Pseudomonadota bacterium]MBU4474703.1 4Fe-4S ferredoxin [Pseudomonadota bacterium]MBU4515970.1 4Fe-4S ferredoxin [Pseudomonadota bacterium]